MRGVDRAELAAVLRTARARVKPADVGLPAGRRRQVPGLRREELAQLAGVGVDYVIRLEQRRYAEALEHLTEAAGMDPARLDAGRTISGGLRRLVLYGAGWSLVATVVVAFLAPAAPGLSRILAVLAALGGALVVWRYAARIPGLPAILSGLLRADRGLALAVYAVAAAPLLLVLYALVGGPWPLVAGITAAMLAEFAALTRTRTR